MSEVNELLAAGRHAAVAERVSVKTGKYVYAIAPLADGAGVYGNIGMNGGQVYAISAGGTSAIVSDFAGAKVRPERQHIAAHHQVLRHLMTDCTVLPMVFGIVAENREAVTRMLSQNQAAFLEQLARVEGKVEMGLRVVWAVPNIFEYLADADADLRALRDKLFGGGRQPSQGDKILLGRLFERTLNEQRTFHTRTVMAVLGSRCAEIKDTGARNEQEVMNLACLVGREAQGTFEEGVFEAAKRFDNNYSLDFTGPWPPHNFVDIKLET